MRAAKEGSKLFVKSNVFDAKISNKGKNNTLKVSTPKGIIEIN